MSNRTKTAAHALSIWQSALKAVDAGRLVQNQICIQNRQIQIAGYRCDLNSTQRIVVVGAGKASGWMARGLWESIRSAGLNIPVIGHVNVSDDAVLSCGDVTIFSARPRGQNLPTQRVVDGTARIMRIIADLQPNDLCVCLISGGGSALLELPCDELSLDDLRAVTQQLSNAGATIGQLNTVRKQLSQVKGGGLARAFANSGCQQHPMLTLILSDIIGDPLDLIASGPSVDDNCSARDALELLNRFDEEHRCPESVRDLIGKLADEEERAGHDVTDCTKSAAPETVRNFVIGNNQTAVEAAAASARELGYHVIIANQTDPEQSATDAASRLLAIAKSCEGGAAVCIVSGGEPVVNVTESTGHGGQGGRNHHLVLSALLKFVNDFESKGTAAEFCLLSGGTDGEDGNVPVAGAVIDNGTVESVIANRWAGDAAEALRSFDSYNFLHRIKSTLGQQLTRTNVCDLRIVLVNGDKSTATQC